MNVYVVIVDEMLRRDGVIDESTIDRDVLEILSSKEAAIEYLEANLYEVGDEPDYYPCCLNRVSGYYWYTHGNKIGKSEIISCAWVEERYVLDSVDYVCNDRGIPMAKCCENCERFYSEDDGKLCPICSRRFDSYDVCDKFALSNHAEIEYEE